MTGIASDVIDEIANQLKIRNLGVNITTLHMVREFLKRSFTTLLLDCELQSNLQPSQDHSVLNPAASPKIFKARVISFSLILNDVFNILNMGSYEIKKEQESSFREKAAEILAACKEIKKQDQHTFYFPDDDKYYAESCFGETTRPNI